MTIQFYSTSRWLSEKLARVLATEASARNKEHKAVSRLQPLTVPRFASGATGPRPLLSDHQMLLGGQATTSTAKAGSQQSFCAWHLPPLPSSESGAKLVRTQKISFTCGMGWDGD